jgi:hypothetical protein
MTLYRPMTAMSSARMSAIEREIERGCDLLYSRRRQTRR